MIGAIGLNLLLVWMLNSCSTGLGVKVFLGFLGDFFTVYTEVCSVGLLNKAVLYGVFFGKRHSLAWAKDPPFSA